MRRLLSDLSELFRREAEHLEREVGRRTMREPDENALREIERLHDVADELWTKVQA